MRARKISPVMDYVPQASFAFTGELGRRLAAVTAQWILPAPLANPALLEMFRNRDRQPYQDQVPWAGEFAGKYLTHAVQILRLTGNARLRQHLAWFVGELLALQADDGYLGPWPTPWRLRPGAPNCAKPWDAWGHYHIMTGLLLWHRDTGDARALQGACRIGDLFCRRFLGNTGETLHGTGEHEMNQAPIHALALLYQLTGARRYLQMARQIEDEMAIPPAGDYLRQALAGREFHQTPKPRWESLHPIMGFAELHLATGRADYRRAFEHLWWSMLQGDRHNNGGFSSGEQATGNPYDERPIETCCTVAWMAMSVEMLRLTGNPVVADELELSLLNSGYGLLSPSGRWVTYNTPMSGQRRASAHDIVFQARPGSPELNCCSVNGPRALGLLSEWAVMTRAGGLALNFYGPGKLRATLPGGVTVQLTQRTGYPRSARVHLTVSPSRATRFTLALRIPHWSARTTVTLNGEQVTGVTPASYLELRRIWRPGDRLRLDFDFRPHLWVNPSSPGVPPVELKDRGGTGVPPVSLDDRPAPSAPASGVHPASLYRGPLLLACDPRHQSIPTDPFPVLDAADLPLTPVTDPTWLAPSHLFSVPTRDGRTLYLCDFASAGLAGNAYVTWLPLHFPTPPPTVFTRTNPLRSFRVEAQKARASAS